MFHISSRHRCTVPQLQRCLDLGVYIGFTGRIAHPGHKAHYAELVQRVPIERLVACTDAPFQIPRGLPLRLAHNEPGMLAWLIEQLASVRGEDPDGLAEVMLENARTALRIDEVQLRKPWYESV